ATVPHLEYYGGPVIQKAAIIELLWGNNVAFPSELADFYKWFVTGPTVDWLSEYDTTSPAQKIERGQFLGVVTDVKAPMFLLDDRIIASEIARLIDDRTLPAPTDDTVIMVHFPPGVQFQWGGFGLSCESFCGVHGLFTHNGKNVYFAAIPD